MRNIWTVFKTDIKTLSKCFFACAVVVAIAVLPSLYAWLNIYSNWDPYGNTGGISIALASLDKGYTDEDGVYVNKGDDVVSDLREATSINWVILDSEKQARDGVYAGDYYAAIIIPQDFSENMVSVLKGDIHRPTIEYYINEKKNAIAHLGFQAGPQGHQWRGRFHGKWLRKGRSKNGPFRQRQCSHKCCCPDSMHRLDGSPLQL